MAGKLEEAVALTNGKVILETVPGVALLYFVDADKSVFIPNPTSRQNYDNMVELVMKQLNLTKPMEAKGLNQGER